MRIQAYVNAGQKVLYADEGKVITLNDVILGDVIWLGKNSKEYEFKEIDKPVDIDVE